MRVHNLIIGVKISLNQLLNALNQLLKYFFLKQYLHSETRIILTALQKGLT